MLTVLIKPNESFEKAVRRFETECRKAKIIQLAKKNMYYEKPSRKKYLKSKTKRKAV